MVIYFSYKLHSLNVFFAFNKELTILHLQIRGAGNNLEILTITF